jgi:cytochrome P450
MFQGYTIPKGWGVTFSIRSTHDQSPFFKEHEDFNPDRWMDLQDCLPQFHFIPFGAGPHSCIGREYARVVWRLYLTTLGKFFAWDVLTPDPKLLVLPVVKPEKGLWVQMRTLKDEEDIVIE